MADVKQTQTALELFFNDKGRYPTAIEFSYGSLYSTSTNGATTYMAILPAAANPPDGNCTTNQNTFAYTATPDGTSYTISYCIGGVVGSLATGPHCATPAGIADGTSCAGGGGSACPSSVSYGGESYPTISIGTQCWLAKNLNIGTYIGSGSSADGFDGIPGNADDCVDVSGQGWGLWSCQGYSGIQKYCYSDSIPGGDPATCTTDGGLYEWAETMGLPSQCNFTNYDCTTDPNTCASAEDPTNCNFPNPAVTKRQGICPTGWHIPSDSDLGTASDWRTLEQGLATDPSCDTTYTWGCSPAGDKLKKRYDNPYTGHNGCNPDGSDCGLSGFEGLLAGVRYANGSFNNRGGDANLWSSLPYSGAPGYAWVRYLGSGNAGVYRDGDGRALGFSVRCLQD